MAVKIYSLARDGQKWLTENFQVKEFACKDGSDQVWVDEALVALLQQLRDHVQAPVRINSAYRTAAHNRKVGGSTQSQHLQGKAADIVVKGVAPFDLACWAEQAQAGGIGLYHGYLHLDTRAGCARWDSTSGKQLAVRAFALPAGSMAAATASPGSAAAVTDNSGQEAERKQFFVDGQAVWLRSFLLQGENYVNLRELAAAWGGQVEYQEQDRSVQIRSRLAAS